MRNGTTSSGEVTVSRVDLTRLGKSPKPFEGTAETWEAFKFNFTTYVGTVDPRLPELLDDASKRTSAIDMTTALTRADVTKLLNSMQFSMAILRKKRMLITSSKPRKTETVSKSGDSSQPNSSLKESTSIWIG